MHGLCHSDAQFDTEVVQRPNHLYGDHGCGDNERVYYFVEEFWAENTPEPLVMAVH